MSAGSPSIRGAALRPAKTAAKAINGGGTIADDLARSVGEPSFAQSPKPVFGTTVQLTDDVALTDGTQMAKGSVVTAVENGYKLVTPDGISYPVPTEAKPGEFLALPSPVLTLEAKLKQAADSVTFYHATTEAGADSIIKKCINLSESRINTDFANGYYTTIDSAQSLERAAKVAARAGDDNSGVVLEYIVSKAELEYLKHWTWERKRHRLWLVSFDLTEVAEECTNTVSFRADA